MPVGFQLQGDIGPDPGQLGPEPGELGKPDAAMGQKLHGRTPLAILGDREARPPSVPCGVAISPASRERASARAAALAAKAATAAGPDAAPGLAQRGQAQIGIVGPQAAAGIRPAR